MPFTGFRWYDVLLLVGLGLLIFGPKRLPELGSAIGKTIKEFQRSMREVTPGSQNEAPATPPARALATPELSAPAPTATTATPAATVTPVTTTSTATPASGEVPSE